MKMLMVIAVLSAVFAVGFTQSTTGTCTNDEQMAFVTNVLGGLTCGLALGRVDTTDSSGLNLLLANVTARSTPLDTVCTAGCGGALSQWLNICCNDTVGSFGLFSWCLQTGDDTAGRDRCYFALPPVLNISMFNSLGVACADSNATFCPDTCMQAYMGIANVLGCCYQSLYNNTNFIQGLVGAGLITAVEYQGLMELGNPFFWDLCGVTPPGECTGDTFPGALPTDTPSTCPATTMMPPTTVTTEGAVTSMVPPATTMPPNTVTTEGAVRILPLVSLTVVLLVTLLFIN